MITLRKVSKTFGEQVTAVDRVSFKVEAGETLGLIGTSGCGKTTTLKTINRLIEPDRGEVLVEGKNVRKQNPQQLRRRIGYVIQDIGLFPHYTVFDNVATVPRLLHWSSQDIKQRCNELLELVGLPPDDFAARYPNKLSGGQQQRVGLARALGADPPVLLMDEPFGALDPITREGMQREFRELKEQLNKTIVLVTHDINEAFLLCDRIALMYEGQILDMGTPSELLYQSGHAYTADFLKTQRFQLELASTPVGKLLGSMHEIEAAGNEGLDVTVDTSLQQIMERSETQQTSDPVVRIHDHNGLQLASTTLEQLFSSYFKNHRPANKA